MSANETEKVAIAWLAREDRGLTGDEAAARDAWLAESSRHKVIYLQLRTRWQRADRLAALNNPAIPLPVHKQIVTPRRLAIAAGLLIAIGGTSVWLSQPTPKPQFYSTALGGIQKVRLADGTQLELNTDTQVHASITPSDRSVTLDAGEAYFEVVHDAARPFVVYAGDRRITDLGTKFSVFRDGDDLKVIVREGKVRIDIAGQQTGTVADAGHEVVTRGSEMMVLEKPAAEIVNDLSWRSGMLVFTQRTLMEMAEQFNRYNARKIYVTGNAENIRIGGSFKTNNIDGFVTLLRRGLGLTVKDDGGRIVVSR